MVSSISAPAGAPYTGTLPADVQSNAAVKTEAVTLFLNLISIYLRCLTASSCQGC